MCGRCVATGLVIGCAGRRGCSARDHAFQQEVDLAKGQQKSNREAKKPKADKNKKKKGGPVPAASPVAAVGKGGKKK